MNSNFGQGTIPEMNTLELAQVYEKQGYGQEAHRIYAALDALESTIETRAGINRTQDFEAMPDKKIDIHFQKENKGEEESTGEKRVQVLLEEWFALLNAKHRMDNYKKLKRPCNKNDI